MPTARRAWIAAVAAAAALACAAASRLSAQSPAPIDVSSFGTISWRSLGPIRGGRMDVVAGVASQPAVYYAGAAEGGVWKTTDYGISWAPIFEHASGAVGAIAVAPSDASVVYVGTGSAVLDPDPLRGDGVYKSTDAGRTWTHVGLADSERIGRIVVDPANASRIFVAALGHAFGANAERGVFRSIDGGGTFERVLANGNDTGAVDVALDPANPATVYAALEQSRLSPWPGDAFWAPGAGLFKSTDGGATWRPIGRGLPSTGWTRLAAGAGGRLFAAVLAAEGGGLYRSEDGGETWAPVPGLPPLAPARCAGVTIDASRGDVILTASRGVWRSGDGGRTFGPWSRVPPGGACQIWINPSAPDFLAVATEAGARVSVNSGTSWTSPPGQLTGSFDRVVTDNAFPYRVCGSASTGGSICVASRGDSGAITDRDSSPVGSSASGSVAPDPNDPDIVFSGAIGRFDRRSEQSQDVTPPHEGDYRILPTAPFLFPVNDSRTLYLGANALWKTTTSGQTWTAISGDLTRGAWEPPASLGIFRNDPSAGFSRRGAISALAPSPIDTRTIWVGTNDGLVHVTHNSGTTWTAVTPPDVQAWADVRQIEASHFDVNGAYVAIDAHRIDDARPHLLRTRDGGATWVDIGRGLSDSGLVNVVREDSQRRGLLFAGTDRSVFVSFDDGESWQSMGLNLPATPVQDLTIKDADLVAATRGRGLWVLDNIATLRQITPDILRGEAFLFRPNTAWRTHVSQADAALGAGAGLPNPPEGAAIDYWMGPGPHGPITIEIIETLTNALLRRFDTTSGGPNERLQTTPGFHRVLWDLRYAPIEIDRRDEPGGGVSTVPGPLVLPGTYQVRLTIDNRPLRQAVVIRLDPRAKPGATDLAVQLRLAQSVADALRETGRARLDLRSREASASPDAIARLRPAAAAIEGATSTLVAALESIEQADARPTPAIEAAAAGAIAQATAAIGDSH